MKKTMKRLIITGVLIAASFCFLSPTQSTAATTWVSLNGVAVRSDRSADDFSYLGTGSAVAAVSGSLFGLAQIQLPDGATIQEIICTVKETNPSGGWIDVLLLRVPLDITDPSVGSTDIIANAFI